MKAINLLFILANVGASIANFVIYALVGEPVSLIVGTFCACVAAFLIWQRMTYTTLR